MLGLFADTFVVPENRPPTVVLVLRETPTAPAICFQRSSGLEQALMVLTLGAPLACSTWRMDEPTCEIVIAPGMGERVLGHEERHCHDHDFHGPLGL